MLNLQRLDLLFQQPRYVHRFVKAGVGQDTDKLVATVARDQINRAFERRLEHYGNMSEAVIPGPMTIVVVVALEEIDVDQNHAQQ